MNRKKNVLIKVFVALLILIIISSCKQSTEPNHDPSVISIVAFPNQVQVSDSFAVFCSADDADGDPLSYDWFCTNHGASIKGALPDNPYELKNTRDNIMIFFATDTLIYQTGHAAIFCDVRDNKGGLKTAWILVGITR